MRLIFEFIYSFLDRFFHKKKIKNYLINLDLDCKIIFDVGSHKGESISFFQSIYAKSKIYGFEPQKNCFKSLITKFQSNKRIKVINCAIGKIKSDKKLHKNFLSTTSTFSKINLKSKHFKIKSFILANKGAGFYKNEITKINTLNYFIKKYKIKNIDLLKIDTEGHEFEVLLGLKNNFKKVKVILIEHNYTDYYLNYNLNKIKLQLINNSFKKIKDFKFPFMNYTDAIYVNTKFFREYTLL